MPTASVAPAVSSPTSLCSSSSAFGMNSITSTPASGRNVPTLSNQFWSRSTSMLEGSSGVDDHENEGADGGRGEQEGAVLADLARLDGLQGAARAGGGLARPVDRTVDDALVDVAVDPATDALGV